MQFYELTHPPYETDYDYNKANPIRMKAALYIPGVICPVCMGETGGGWASSNRIRVKVPKKSTLRQYLMGQSLPLEQWREFVVTLRSALKIPSWMPVAPGAQIGQPKGELLSEQLPDMMHPFPGQLIVQARVVEALKEARLTGFQPVRVEVQWGKTVKSPRGEPPALYELLVTGTAWRVGMDLESITVCKECERITFPHPDWLVVDESRWDGSDFFHVDRNPNIVLVTERVCRVLARHRFTNYHCVPLPPKDV